MKNLIISTFLILAMIVGGSMNNVPASVANLFGSVEASAQLKNPKACDSATGQVPYGEFVVNSASIEVVERDGKAGTPLPKNILVDAIKKSGFQDLAGKTDDQIIALAVAEQRCVISPINYVSVVVNAMSATRLVYCGLSYTTKGNTYTKVNKQIVADTEGYGAYNVEVQCKQLPCPNGTIFTLVNGVQKCEPVAPECPVGQIKVSVNPLVCETPKKPECIAPATGTYPNCVPPCVPPSTGIYPNCVYTPPVTPEPTCPAGSTKNPTTNICEVPCPQGTTKNAQGICEAPKPPETPAKKGISPVAIGLGILAFGGLAWALLRKKTPPPTVCVPPSTGTPPNCETPPGKTTPPTRACVREGIVTGTNGQGLTSAQADAIITNTGTGRFTTVKKIALSNKNSEWAAAKGTIATGANRNSNANIASNAALRNRNASSNVANKSTNVTPKAANSTNNKTNTINATATFAVMCVNPRTRTPPPVTNINSCPPSVQTQINEQIAKLKKIYSVGSGYEKSYPGQAKKTIETINNLSAKYKNFGTKSCKADIPPAPSR